MSSNRVKRLLKRIENLRGNRGKRRRISGSDAESCKGGASLWAPKSFGDFPTSNIYNSTSRSPPAELFRKDLISAMKLPDSEPLSPEEYWFISDPWKQEWERGVQVPVNPEALPEPSVRVLRKKDKTADFKLPKKFLRITHDEFFSNDLHQMSMAPTQAEQVCRYDLDDCDFHWLKAANEQRRLLRLPVIEESKMEVIMETLEGQCYEYMQDTIHSEAGLGIEYDEDVICDVCRSPDSEEGNEMVFCDSCDICVHQACYGITEIPEGSWLCCTCSLTIKPNCVLCPNKGGAMKCTRNGQKWAHVSCALWIPEVSIGCVEKMEPITKISHIPQSRWGLICCLCRERVGACIQCSVKTCKIAYHVTCGFQNGLEMKAVVEDENDEDGVKLRSYCPKHSKNKDLSTSTDSEEECDESSRSRTCAENTADRANVRAKRLHQIESGFYKYVKVQEISTRVKVPLEIVEFIYQYWKLKRRSGFNMPLIHPRSGENEALGQEQEDGLYARMKMFVHLRQDLERVRNLCYMVSRREKLSRSWYCMREQIFQKQLSVLTDPAIQLKDPERESIIHACHGTNIYDRLSSHNSNCCVKVSDPALPPESLNGSVFKDHGDANKTGKGQQQHKQKTSSERLPNPYAKTYYFNGVHNRSRRRSGGGGGSGGDVEGSRSGAVKLEEIFDNFSDGDRIETRTRSESVTKRSMEPCDGDERTVCASASATEGSPDIADNSRVEAEEEVAVCSSDNAFTSPTFEAKVGAPSEKSAAAVNGDGASGIDDRPDEDYLPVKPRLRNGLGSTDKRHEGKRCEESLAHFAKDNPGRDSLAKESMERDVAEDVPPPPRGKVSERKSDEKGEGDGCSRRKCRKSKQRPPPLRSPTEKLSPKDRNKKLGFLSDSAPFRDKLREESAKVHETLFSHSLKGSLIGYRIPKKSRSESESENRQEVPTGLSSPQPVQQPPPVWKESKSPTECGPPPPQQPAVWKESKSPTECGPPPPQQPTVWKESKSPTECGPQQPAVWKENKSPTECRPPPRIPQSPPPPWNGANLITPLSPPPPSPAFLPRPPALLPTPPALLPTPPATHMVQNHPETRNMRRDRYMSPPPPVLVAPHLNGRENGCSPRLVIKLRKDPNYPESPRWRRDGDIQDESVYDFKCESSPSPPKHIRLKLNTKLHRHAYKRPSGHLRHTSAMPEMRSPGKGGSKYSMRTRTHVDEGDMVPGVNSSYS